MTEQIAALDALIEAVEAGSLPEEDWRLMHDIWSPRNWHEIGHNVRYSMHGSLDAAKALHEALLPGWEWGVTLNSDEPTPAAYVAKWGAPEGSMGDGFEAQADNPARAWLLAVLKAYRAGL